MPSNTQGCLGTKYCHERIKCNYTEWLIAVEVHVH